MTWRRMLGGSDNKWDWYPSGDWSRRSRRRARAREKARFRRAAAKEAFDLA